MTAVVVALAGLAAALLLRLAQGSWLAPGALTLLVWLTLAFLPALLAPEYYYSGYALAVILTLTVLTACGAVFGQSAARLLGGRPVAAPPRLRLIEPLLLALTVLGLLAVAITLAGDGNSFAVFTDAATLAETARRFAVARYHHGYLPPLSARLLLTAVYLGALLGGLRAGVGSQGSILGAWFSLLPLLPALGFTLLLTARAVFLWALILWLSAYFAARVWRSAGGQVLSFRLLLRLALLLAAVLLLFLVVQMMRGEVPLGLWRSVAGRLQVWFLGYLAGFSVWLDSAELTVLPRHWGRFTLAGVAQLLGVAERDQGIYREFLAIAPYLQTNIFTVFRPLLEDFGLLGAGLVLTSGGAAAGWAYAGVIAGRRWGLPVLAAFWSFLAWSPVTSLFAYNTLLLAYILFALYVWLCCGRAG